MKIHEFITSENWCQKALCKDKNGAEYHWPYGNHICQWCLGGMVLYCYPKLNDHDRIFKLLIDKITKPLHRWNDSPERTWEDVKKLCEELDI